MMAEVLSAFASAFSASLFLAAPAALVWGVLSVALSPCHLSSVPLVVAYMSGGSEMPSRRRALAISSAFALGILASIAVIGALTAAAGRMLGDVGRTGTWVLAAVFIVFGLNLLGVLPLPSFGVTAGVARRRGVAGALLLGLVFGAALGPCTFAFMAPLLGLVLHAGEQGAAFGVLLVALFGIGHAGAIAFAGASFQSVQRWLSRKGGASAIEILRAGAGVAVLCGGLYFVYIAR
jgi:cytochrome c-type biogenesis protein